LKAELKETRLIILKDQAVRLARILVKEIIGDEKRFEDLQKKIQEATTENELYEIIFGS